MNTKEIPAATEEVAEIFSLYCSDKLLSDDTPAFALYLAGYQAATSRQATKIKALVDAAELVIAWYEAEDDHAKEPDFYKRIEMCRASEDALRSAIALVKETP